MARESKRKTKKLGTYVLVLFIYIWVQIWVGIMGVYMGEKLLISLFEAGVHDAIWIQS
jgi:heme A synthase